MAKANEKKDAKPTTKKRAKAEKRRIVVLISDGIDGYEKATGADEAQPEHATSVDAMKWIKQNGVALKGKTLVIASMTKPRELKEKTPVTPNFDFG